MTDKSDLVFNALKGSTINRITKTAAKSKPAPAQKSTLKKNYFSENRSNLV